MTTIENKALVQKIMEARSRRDHEPFVAAIADDFIWRIIGSTAWSGEYVGKVDVRERLLKPLYAQFVTPSRITAKRILADGDYVVAQCGGCHHGVRRTLRQHLLFCYPHNRWPIARDGRIHGHGAGRSRPPTAAMAEPRSLSLRPGCLDDGA